MNAIIEPYENIMAHRIFIYYLFENNLFSSTTYFYFFDGLEAALLGGTGGLSR